MKEQFQAETTVSTTYLKCLVCLKNIKEPGCWVDPLRTCAASLSELGNVGGFVSTVIQLCDAHFKKDSFGYSVKNTL